jgi:hypothetical protein
MSFVNVPWLWWGSLRFLWSGVGWWVVVMIFEMKHRLKASCVEGVVPAGGTTDR